MNKDDDQKANFLGVLLPSGKIVPPIDTNLRHNEHCPEHLLDWLEKYGKQLPPDVINLKRKLCNDMRMVDMWAWLGSVRFKNYDKFRGSLSVSDQIYRSTNLPGKPGDMTPTKREAYFKKVRSHAEALIALLEGTRFDNDYMSEVSEEKLSRPLHRALASWGDDEYEEGHVVAFQVTPDGAYQHHYNFPENMLTETLYSVLSWTHWDDAWDGGIWSTSAPIAQANSESTQAVYFNCTLFDWFQRNGVQIPFPILATVANVALDIAPERQLDEEAVRKQVRRYQARRAKQGVSDSADTGQNFTNWDDSVLSDPF